MIEEATLADSVGVDFIGLGEHHRDDFAISAPEIVLAAIAARTSRIRLGTAVTVLCSDDPVRVFERFATLDALSNGRAEVILGRGSFTESFPLFGYELDDYEVLFEEKLELFAALLKGGAVTWSGTMRPPLENQRVCPPVGAARAASLGRRRRQPGVGGARRALRPAADARDHRRRPGPLPPLRGTLPARLRPARPARAADGRALPRPRRRDRRRSARGDSGPATRRSTTASAASAAGRPRPRDRFEAEIAEGALYVGSPETVARKIARTVRVLGAARFDMKYSSGTMAHAHSDDEHRALRHAGHPDGAGDAGAGGARLIRQPTASITGVHCARIGRKAACGLSKTDRPCSASSA